MILRSRDLLVPVVLLLAGTSFAQAQALAPKRWGPDSVRPYVLERPSNKLMHRIRPKPRIKTTPPAESGVREPDLSKPTYGAPPPAIERIPPT